MLRPFLLSLVTALSADAQSLLDVIAKVSSLPNFTAFYRDNAAFAHVLLGNTTTYPITFLAPNDQAIASYQTQYGVSISSLPPATLLAVLQYRTLVSSLTKDNFTNDGGRGGTTIPTMLTTQSNNRSVGISLAARFGGAQKASGLIVFVHSSGSGSSHLGLQPLEGDQGVWDGGLFHIVDGLLTPPQLCAKTIRSANLTLLDNAFNRTKLWPSLDGSKNVTCLGLSNEAFANAGSPDSKLEELALSDAILFHTLPEVAYSDYLYNGREFKTLQNGTVRVRVEGEGLSRSIWFNNAKIFNPNVLTHNGLMRVLDAVMLPLEQTKGTASATPSSTPSATGPSLTGTGSASTGALNTMTDFRSWKSGLAWVLSRLWSQGFEIPG
ncbi:FAS1 domain-containing protein [Setomelanomma holmii]|uniref:FAS1 domain-containing protein n=1 Tax=Setomelanomma holmii TaxID=210430 RepID=A0A9P4GXJ1_9PLEO|nr:FAS1 domain-containing protein [Setomelanomma holmii]